MIRVLVDCTALPHNHAGVGRYLQGVIPSLCDDDSIELHLVVQARDARFLRNLAPNATVHAISAVYAGTVARLFWEQLLLPRFARSINAEIVHSPHYTFPIAWQGPHVVTLHDATFFSDPNSHTFVKRHFFRFWTRLTWRFATVVITPSAATASEVERFIGSPFAHIHVAHLGVDPSVFRPPTAKQNSEFRKLIGAGPDDTWFAFLGTIEPRKNMSAILEGYARVRAELGVAAPALLVSGARGWDKEAIAKLDALTVDSGVRELGYLPLASLSALLGGAVATVYPSLGEGFGLPVLEAMACGAAVITTDRLAIPEVGGNAVYYTKPDAQSIGDAMLVVARDRQLTAELHKKALLRSTQFTWAETARAHSRAYVATTHPKAKV